jgi:hypothetical protein
MSASNTKADGAVYTTTPIGSDPEFTTVPGAQWRYSLGRSALYQAISEGKVESISLRRPGALRGKRLLKTASIKAWLASMPTGIDETLSKHCRKANAKAQIAREENKRKRGAAEAKR